MKKDKKKISLKVNAAPTASTMEYYGPPPRVTIEPLKKGYVIRSDCGKGDPEFVKNLMGAPSIIKRLFNVGNKSYSQIKDMTDEEE